MSTRSLGRRMSKPDYAVMRRMHRWRPPKWVRWWMILSTRLGDGWLWVAIGMAVLGSGSPARVPAVLSALAAAGMSVLLFMILKRMVGRPRPCALEPHSWSTLQPPDHFSFPSGHSMTAFAIATALVAFYPPSGGVLYFCAGSVALSRIVLGMHFTSDVLVGSGIGVAIGYFCAAAFII